MTKKGIDISKYQKDIDWQKVKNDGIEFAIIRIGYGKYDNQKDPYFEKNYEGATKVGIPVGVYHYSYATTIDEAKLEAGVVLCWLNKRKLDLPVYFDIEDKCQSSLSKSTLTDICKAFCNRIEEAGYWAGIYANKNWFTSLIDGPTLGERYTYWIAQYNDKCTYTGTYDMWQYSSSGKVNGISGNVDMNYMYRDLISEIGGEQIKTNSEPTTKTNNQTTNQTKIYTGSSLVDYLKSIGIDSSFSNRKKLATANGINGYTGTAAQNTTLLAKLRDGTTTNVSYYTKYSGTSTSIVDALKAIGVDSSLSNRTLIAKNNGINDYTGTASQNTLLLNLLKQGKLKK